MLFIVTLMGRRMTSRILISVICFLFALGFAGSAHAETDTEKAGSFNRCLQGWVNEHKLNWKSQEFTKDGDHLIRYDDGSVAVEHKDGTVDIEKTDGAGKKSTTRICPPKTETGTPPTTPPKEPPPKDDMDDVPLGPGVLNPKEERLLKCATKEEAERIKGLQRDIEGLQRTLEIVNKPVEEAEEESRRATDEAYAYRTSVSEEEARAPAFQKRLAELEDKANDARHKVYDAKKAVEDRIAEINNQINDIDQEIRSLLGDIAARGDCPPPGKTEPPSPGTPGGTPGTTPGTNTGKPPAKPGPGLPVPSKPFVLPKLPKCFEDEKERKAFDDMVYELFLEQINASSLGSTPQARDAARGNVDDLSKLRGKISKVPYCPATLDDSHASNPLRDILGHVTIGVGVDAGGDHHRNGHDDHDDRDRPRPTETPARPAETPPSRPTD